MIVILRTYCMRNPTHGLIILGRSPSKSFKDDCPMRTCVVHESELKVIVQGSQGLVSIMSILVSRFTIDHWPQTGASFRNEQDM